MLKQFGIIILCLIIGTGESFSQSRERGNVAAEPLAEFTPQWQAVLQEQPASLSVELLYSDIQRSVIRVQVPGVWLTAVRQTGDGPEFMVTADDGSPLLEKGAPDLSKAIASLIVPDQDQMDIKVISSEYIDLKDIRIAPSKGNITRAVAPSEVPFEYGNIYNRDAFYPGKLAEVRQPYIIRDLRGQAAVFYPVHYNPVKHILRIYHTLTVEVYSKSHSGSNTLEREGDEESIAREFNKLYEKHFLNFSQHRSALRYTPVEEEGRMLIISYGTFIPAMQEFKNWKVSRGIPTEIVDVATIGGASQIKSYVQNYYNTYGLTYLLLVGDNAQVPASSTSAGPSDNNYSYVAGDDHYPDLFVGRFSAENISQVQTQVQRSIDYEKNAAFSADHFGRAIMIGSSQGPGDDGEMDWQHQRNIRTNLVNYDYFYGAELYEGSQGGYDASGNPTSSMLASEINSGSGFISYTGHGNTTAWGTTGFSTSSITNSLTNNGKLPVIISVACLNGNFTSSTCFAETWLRATYNNEPKGAVGALMSTINQAWNPPMDGQDEMVDIVVESYAGNIKRTFGGVAMNGCMKMNDTYGVNGEIETDTWTLFGDPSLSLRTSAPEPMNVVHSAYLPLGTSQVQVQCDHDGVLAVITDDNLFVDSAYVSNGTATLQFSAVNATDTMTITVAGHNTVSHQSKVYFTDAPMTYVSSEALQNNLHGVAPGSPNEDVIAVKVRMTGTSIPQSATSFRINLNGTTNINDISLVKIYYSGLSSQFSSANLFGSGAPATNNFLVEGNQVLVGGDNYFWIAADVVTNAPIGNLLDAECIRVTVAGSQKTPAVTAPTGFRPIDIMQYQSATTLTAGSGFVNPGAQNAELIKLKVVTEGEPDPLVLESLSFSLAGTSDLADIDNIKIYYTGNDSTFSPDQLYATVAPGSGTLTVTAEKPLAAGGNYFWFTADVAVTASSGNKLDASCLGFTIGETAHAPSVSNPEGSRVIEAVYCTPQFYYGTSYGDYISLVSLGSINNSTGAAAYPYYNFYQTTTTELFRGNTYTLTVSAGTYSSNRIAAWIDYDQSGTFESWEKLGEVSLGARPASAGITFTIPDTAGYGYMRLRVREVFNTTDLDPCATYYYGETEDYRVEVYPDGLWLGTSSDWNNPSNWYNGQVPGPSTSVLIPSPAVGEVLPTVFGGANPQCHDITIETGVSLVIPQGVTFTVHGGTSM